MNRADLCLRMQRLVSRIATMQLELSAGRLDGIIHNEDLAVVLYNIEQELDSLEEDDGEIF